jgi:hypothetical protein
MEFLDIVAGDLVDFAQDGVRRVTYRAVATTPPVPYSTLQVPRARILDCRRETEITGFLCTGLVQGSLYVQRRDQPERCCLGANLEVGRKRSIMVALPITSR